MGKRTLASICIFCEKPLNGKCKYIYPIPEGFIETQTDNVTGARACSKCAPPLAEAQVDQGLVQPVRRDES